MPPGHGFVVNCGACFVAEYGVDGVGDLCRVSIRCMGYEGALYSNYMQYQRSRASLSKCALVTTAVLRKTCFIPLAPAHISLGYDDLC